VGRFMYTRNLWSVLALTVLTAFRAAPASGDDSAAEQQVKVSFNHQIRPILSDKCFQCHGPDAEDRQADTRLDIPDEADLEAIVDRITSTDPDVMMPPPDSNKQLTQSQIAALKQWVQQGAPYEKHWAFLPPAAPAVPVIDGAHTSDHPVDRFVLRRLQRDNLKPANAADKRTLIRRVSLDLTGLPPAVEEVQAFLNDESPTAWENLVDRLLQSPHFGEHMARYWLDLVRFADTNGLHHDHYREMTPYRDWVIRAFNDNLPFDQFVTDQIAGDLHQNPTTDQQIASGFNRLHLIIDRGTALPEESFNRNVVDRVSSVGTAFLGLTLECAVCHDHKYDPITQRDFYQLYAFFNNFDGGPETGGRGGLDFQRGLQPPYLELPTPEQAALRKQLNDQIAALQQQVSDLKDQESEADTVAALKDELAKLQKERDQLIREIPATLVMKERSEIRPAHILIRGNYDQPGELVQRNTPGFLPPIQSASDVPSRMDLAEWLVAPNNPLTARVAVNRFWQQLFGVGLVRTSEDFGAQGEPPSHPELLDDLTLRFTQSGWNVKQLIRFIVTSDTYRQSSRSTPEQFRNDPQNRLLARGSRYRLDAEVVRDQVLATTGLLNRTLYGRSVKPPQPEGLWKIVAMPYSYPREFEPDTGDKIYRRSVYSFWKRALPPPQMTIFDAPTREACTARRERTNTPLQALLLMNETQYFTAAMTLAHQLNASDKSDTERIAAAWEIITSQVPDQATSAALVAALEQFRVLYRDDPAAAQQMIDGVDRAELKRVTEPQQQQELAAMTMVVHSLLNMDATRNRE
jgi:mono/diheme cytochrome c family protein